MFHDNDIDDDRAGPAVRGKAAPAALAAAGASGAAPVARAAGGLPPLPACRAGERAQVTR